MHLLQLIEFRVARILVLTELKHIYNLTQDVIAS